MPKKRSPRPRQVPATKPYFFSQDITYITRRFQDILAGKSFLSMGKYSAEFEQKFAAAMGTKYAVACNSGTSALELIYMALGVAGKEVIMPSNTFAATAYAALRAGAKLVFAECGEDMCLDADAVAPLITANTGAVVHVHIGGLVSPSVLKLKHLCQQHDIPLIEDAAQAHSASLKGIKAGAFGIAGAFSFFSTKVMTTGEGGMVTTNDAQLVEKMKSMREFGKVKQDVYINYHTSLGYNWRLPEVAALMGLRQLAALPRFIRSRQKATQHYTKLLAGRDDINIIQPVDSAASNYFKYIIMLPHHDRLKVHHALLKQGVFPSGYVYEFPLHKQPVFKDYNHLTLPQTEYVCARHLCLPIFYGMTKADVEYVVDALDKALAA
jgi:perosamine synthetase